MKNILLFLIVISPMFVFSQQNRTLSHYYNNLSVINPSAITMVDNTELKINLRNQWNGFSEDKSVNAGVLTFNKFIKDKSFIGLEVNNDNTGNLANSSLLLKYGHLVELSNKSKLGFGLSGGMTNIYINEISFLDAASVINEQSWIPNANFGFSFFNDAGFYLGSSISGLIGQDFELTNTSTENTFNQEINTVVRLNKELSPSIDIQPSILHKKALENSSGQIDGSLIFNYKELFSLGANFRAGKNINLSDGFGVHFGINIGRIIVNISQDFSSGNLSSYRTSELTLEYIFSDMPVDEINKEDKVDSTNIVKNKIDSDGDGVIDDEDECPNVFGSLSAKGCPDADGDGIEDKDDVCPNTQGFNTINGCPILSRKDSVILNSAISNLYFDTNSEKIKSTSHQSLNEMSRLLLANRNMILIIHGHTDSDASDQYNLNLSARRAKSVRDFILKRGVVKKKVIMDWFGEANPLVPNDSELNKSKNRRVEFSITFM